MFMWVGVETTLGFSLQVIPFALFSSPPLSWKRLCFHARNQRWEARVRSTLPGPSAFPSARVSQSALPCVLLCVSASWNPFRAPSEPLISGQPASGAFLAQEPLPEPPQGD